MKKRILIFFIVESILLSSLCFRMWYLCGNQSLVSAGYDQNIYTLNIKKCRGNIYDRNGEKLVNTSEKYVAAVIPGEVEGNVFSYFPASVRETLSRKIGERKPFLFPCDNTLPQDIPGVSVYKYTERYSDDQIAGNIIGYTDSSGAGVAGIEKYYDGFLSGSGESLSLSYSVNAYGEVLSGEDRTDSLRPENYGVILTIDSSLQRLAESMESKIRRGAIVITDPYSGEILAGASFPRLNVNDISGAIKDPDSPFYNRIFAPYSIGSTFKTVMCAAALENGISEKDLFTCEGTLELGDTVFRCHKSSGHGTLDMYGAMEQSCNPFFIALGQRLGFAAIRKICENLRVGTPVDLGDGYTVSGGTLPCDKDIRTMGDLANFSFGQGSLTATPITLCAIVGAVVNSGKYISPTLIKGIKDESGVVSAVEKPSGSTAFSPETALKIKDFMISTVENGTAQSANPGTKGAGGKTGSAETGQYKETGEQIITSLFTGFFPKANPQYIITVIKEDGVSGSVDCAPVFRDICQHLDF